MGVGTNFGEAFLKAQWGAGVSLPREGRAFLSVHDRDKQALLPIAKALHQLGFALVATAGTAAFLRARGLTVEAVFKVNEGRPHVVDRILSGEIGLVINTPLGQPSYYDDKLIRTTALQRRIPLITTLPGAASAVEAIRTLRAGELSCRTLQEVHRVV